MLHGYACAMIFALFAIISVNVSSVASEGVPVFDIFGITTEEVDHYPQGKSQCLKWDQDRMFCPTGWQLGNVRMESLTFMYVRGRLAEVRGTAKHGEFRLLINTLRMKYGEPDGTVERPVWHFRGGTLIARQIEPDFSRNLADGEFIFISEENSKLPVREPRANF